MKKKIITYLLTAGILINSIFASNVFAASKTAVSLFTNKDNVKVGEEFTVTLKGENLNDLYGYEEVVNYDSSKLEFKGIKSLDSGIGFPVHKIDGNKIKFGYTQIGNRSGQNGNKDLCVLTFKVKEQGTADIILQSFEAVNSNVIGEVYDLNQKVSVVINEENKPGKSTNYDKSTHSTNKEDKQVDKIIMERISGFNRIETAINISKSGWEKSDSVVLTNAYNFPDALAGTTYAYMKNAPILLSNNDKIDDAVINEVKRLKAKDVYILGGFGAISKDVENVLLNNNVNVTRLQGNDRYETAVEIGQQVVNSNHTDKVFLAYGNDFPDALSASTFAASKGYPILFTDTDNLNVSTANALKDWKIKKVFILGGTGVINNDVEKSLTAMNISVERQEGKDRYDTAMNIVKRFSDNNIKGLTIASGQDFPDVLAGSVLAAKNNAPILIYNKSEELNNFEEYIKTTVKGKKLYIIGGEGVISQDGAKNIIK